MQQGDISQAISGHSFAAGASTSRAGCVAGVLTVVLGLLVLAAWVLGIPSLKSVIPGAVEMKANTALGLVLSGRPLPCFRAQGGRRRKSWRAPWHV